MTEEETSTFLNPEKPNFYMKEIERISDNILDVNDIYLPDITEADIAIPIIHEREIAGFGFIFIDEKEDGTLEGTLMRMIDPEHQKKGLSHKLLAEIIRVARSKKLRKLISVVKNTTSSQKALIEAGMRKESEDEGKARYSIDLE